MFTPVETSIGALLLHQATSVLLYQNGTVLGVSGIVRQLFTAPSKPTIAFFAGMAASCLPPRWFLSQSLTTYPSVPSTLQSAIATLGAGLLVGWGTKAAQGCTSGHMLCGLSQLNAQSALAVATFFPMAILTHHLSHPTLMTEVCTGGSPCYMPTYPSRKKTVSLILLTAATIIAARVIPRLFERAPEPKPGKQETPNDLPRLATTLFSGFELGLGLQITQMASPAKVSAFLSFPNLPLWDPSLALVILFGVLPSLIENRIRGFVNPPRYSDKFALPTQAFKDTDWKFVAGAAVFGVGWGLTGTCPGPAILRAFAQPVWGLLWMGGFWLGGLVSGDVEGEKAGPCG